MALIIFVFCLLLPFLLTLYQNKTILRTIRLNLVHLQLSDLVIIHPSETFNFTFKAQDENLTQIRIFAQTQSSFSLFDHYTLRLKQISTGEEYLTTFSAFSLWDKVATLKFPGISDSQNQDFQISIKANTYNSGNIELARAYQDTDQLIFQPYYSQPISFLEALRIVIFDRLSWRLFPFLILIPLGGYLIKFYPISKK
ncbi:MAG: hypothetical protein UT55_C0050G0005 [Candidatus Peregrinibacteria bacterium GW2011_GWE2_39_6]|nr:MAG: hypothetical protein UT36_C0001G0115 [Candidatus Peregrinibacteria bacterium GW2011_GWF2_39_17]KKR25053.1 MAG: hypothetical protein UT55_C0050G0005 [Candidatus Peregrinibacteria bacterium GW2011_GWE2_39_6]HCW32552.1 hypothetical protein [Candidatus Peregrinibacteria bacterium]